MEIDEKLLEKAQEHGIDLRTFLEVKLYDFLTGKEEFYNSKPLRYSEIKEDFEKWIKGKISLDTAERYLDILKDLDEITPEALINLYQKRPANNVSKAIRNLVNYLLEKELIDERTANKIKKELPIKRGKGDKVIPTDQDIKEAFEYFKEHLNEGYYLVALILLHSGARLEHVVKMLNEWDPKYLEIKNGFARYEIHHLAEGFKEGFWIYMPTWLAESISRSNVSYDYAKQVINYKAKSGRLVSAKYIRKWFNNFLVRQKVEKDVRNFILGRIGEIKKSVEGDHYLELLQHADREYPRIIREFPIRVKKNLTHNANCRELKVRSCTSRNVKSRKS